MVPRLAIACVLLLGASVLSAAPAGAAGVSLSKTTGPPTTALVVTATGFMADETVDISFDARAVGTGTAGTSGDLPGVRIHVPRWARPGPHRISAVGQTSAATASARFLVRTDWLQWGFWANHAGRNPYENVLSRSNVGRLAVRWSLPAGGPVPYSAGTSAATVGHGLVYFGTWDTTYAVDASTGDVRWRFVTGTITGGTAVSNGVLYAIGGSPCGTCGARLYALNAFTGAQLWSFVVDVNHRSGPTVAGGVVYIGSNGAVYALDGSTGVELWSFPTGSQTLTPPTVANGVVYVGTYSGDGNIYALDASTGAELWSFFAGNSGATGAPVVVRGVAYVSALDHAVYALDAASGAVLWRFSTAGTNFSAPAVAGGRVFVGSGDHHLYALAAGTGRLLWSFLTPARLDLSPSVANGVVYAVSQRGNLYALGTGTGKLLWRFSTNFGNVPSTPAIANGMVYVGADRFFAFGLPR